MPKDNSEVEYCELCGSAEDIAVASGVWPLCKYKHPYYLLCVDCIPEVIDKVTKEPHLYKPFSRN